MSGNSWIIIGILAAAISAFSLPYGFHIKSKEETGKNAEHSSAAISNTDESTNVTTPGSHNAIQTYHQNAKDNSGSPGQLDISLPPSEYRKMVGLLVKGIEFKSLTEYEYGNNHADFEIITKQGAHFITIRYVDLNSNAIDYVTEAIAWSLKTNQSVLLITNKALDKLASTAVKDHNLNRRYIVTVIVGDKLDTLNYQIKQFFSH